QSFQCQSAFCKAESQKSILHWRPRTFPTSHHSQLATAAPPAGNSYFRINTHRGEIELIRRSMDFNFWNSRVHSAKHFSPVQAAKQYYSGTPGEKQFDIASRMSSYSVVVDQSGEYHGLDSESEDEDVLIEKMMEALNRWDLGLPHEVDSDNLALQSATNQQGDGVDASDVGSEGDYDGMIPQYDSFPDEDNHLGLDESEGEEDAKAFFPCPFCYVDIDVHVLCTHLQDEHCFNLRNAVCPLCAANLGNDVIGHFIVQHASSLKKRRKAHRSGPWTGGNNSAVSGRALSSFGGSSTTSSIGNISELAPDLSPFLGSVPELDSRSWQQQQQDSSEKPSSGTHLKSSGGELSVDDRLDREERAQKAAFIQELIASTIF
ncbi:unnamed protein product, partial [Linum tenue]